MKYKVIAKVDFNGYTIEDANHYQVPMNNYAPNIQDIIEGVPTSGTFLGQYVIGIPFTIQTNGSQSTQGQITTQTIPLSLLQEVNDSGLGSSSNSGDSNVNPPPKPIAKKQDNTGMIVLVIIVILLIIALFL